MSTKHVPDFLGRLLTHGRRKMERARTSEKRDDDQREEEVVFFLRLRNRKRTENTLQGLTSLRARVDTTAAQLRVCLWVPVRERAFWTWRRAKDSSTRPTEGKRGRREREMETEKRKEEEEEEEGTISNLSYTKDRRKREKKREG